MKLKILVGTVGGTAGLVAQAVQMDCAGLVDEIEIQPMDGLDISVFREDALFLVCTSTGGAGDVPDNARALYDALDLTPEYLGQVDYGILALGDAGSHNATFCFAGKLFDERLQGLGARRVGDLYCHDASEGTAPEAEGVAWCRTWLPEALARRTG